VVSGGIVLELVEEEGILVVLEEVDLDVCVVEVHHVVEDKVL